MPSVEGLITRHGVAVHRSWRRPLLVDYTRAAGAVHRLPWVRARHL